jgi:hypothetical protein
MSGRFPWWARKTELLVDAPVGRIGERTLAFNFLQGRGRHSGADVDMASAQMVMWREDALEPIDP